MRDRRQEIIHSQGFNMVTDPISLPKSEFEKGFDTPEHAAQEYARMRVGLKTIDDAIIDLSQLKKVSPQYADKTFILNALAKSNAEELRNISNQFYRLSGIYQEVCKYLAGIYRFDWYVTPYYEDSSNKNKLLNDFSKVLEYLDQSEIRRLFYSISLCIMKEGAYYGILVDLNSKFTIQQLPAKYCRSRFKKGLTPIVELNMRFFDAEFPMPQQRIQILKVFPRDIQLAYIKYKEGKLPGDYPGDKNGWYIIDSEIGIKFNLGDSDLPPLVQAIPAIIDLDEAQALDRRKIMQQLLKIIIQKLPMDKNGELIFDVSEAKDIHNNAVAMLRRAIGVDVLTTPAEIDVADMADKNTATTSDDLQRAERTVYNALGKSKNLWNTEGNVALEKSILVDESSVKDLIYQYTSLLNRVVEKFNRPKHYTFRATILETTIFNHKELSKMYKEQTQLGFSIVLPQVALGHSQSSIIATASFENNILHLSEIMVPPMSSNTMSPKAMQQQKVQQPANTNTGNGAGRPEKDNDQKSEKTIKNRESMGKE